MISGLTKVDQQLLSPRLTYQPTTLSFEEAVQIMYVLGLSYGVCHCKLAEREMVLVQIKGFYRKSFQELKKEVIIWSSNIVLS